MKKKRKGRKRRKTTKSITRQFRTTKAEDSRMMVHAKIYAGGNISKWIRYCIENCPPKYLK